VRAGTAITALGLGLTMVACGGGGEKDRPAASSASSPKAAVTVDMVGLEFEPARVTIERGETVKFVNRGEVTHNAKGKGFFSRVVEPGGTYSHRFDSAGSFHYVCTFHPGMEGTLTVS
jgi:plastocyanin